jgi:hypothetical protein
MTKKGIALILLGAFLMGGCAVKQYRESKISTQHPNWDEVTIQKLARREVEPGMTSEMVRAALGIPDSISRSNGHEKWGYGVFIGDYEPQQDLVYFVFFEHNVVVKTAGDRSRLKTLNWYD